MWLTKIFARTGEDECHVTLTPSWLKVTTQCGLIKEATKEVSKIFWIRVEFCMIFPVLKASFMKDRI